MTSNRMLDHVAHTCTGSTTTQRLANARSLSTEGALAMLTTSRQRKSAAEVALEQVQKVLESVI